MTINKKVEELFVKFILPDIITHLEKRSREIDKWYKLFEDMILREQKKNDSNR